MFHCVEELFEDRKQIRGQWFPWVVLCVVEPIHGFHFKLYSCTLVAAKSFHIVHARNLQSRSSKCVFYHLIMKMLQLRSILQTHIRLPLAAANWYYYSIRILKQSLAMFAALVWTFWSTNGQFGHAPFIQATSMPLPPSCSRLTLGRHGFPRDTAICFFVWYRPNGTQRRYKGAYCKYGRSSHSKPFGVLLPVLHGWWCIEVHGRTQTLQKWLGSKVFQEMFSVSFVK